MWTDTAAAVGLNEDLAGLHHLSSDRLAQPQTPYSVHLKAARMIEIVKKGVASSPCPRSFAHI